MFVDVTGTERKIAFQKKRKENINIKVYEPPVCGLYFVDGPLERKTPDSSVVVVVVSSLHTDIDRNRSCRGVCFFLRFHQLLSTSYTSTAVVRLCWG